MSINRRQIVVGAAWAAPVIATSTIVPAYAASSTPPTLDIDYGLFVSTQNNGGYIGYATANNPTGAPTTPAAYFSAVKSGNNPESDLNWNDGASRPTASTYVNGEGSFTPVTNSTSGNAGSYSSTSGFWFSVPTTAIDTGDKYISGSTATLAAGATFVTEVEFHIPKKVSSEGDFTYYPGDNLKVDGDVWNKTLTGKIVAETVTASQTAYLAQRIGGTWTTNTPINTKNSDGSYTFNGTITFTTTQAYTLTQKGSKYYAEVIIMPGTVEVSKTYGWSYYQQTSYVQTATINYSGNGISATKKFNSGDLLTVSRINP